jgi:ubiquitin-protein ligase
MNFSKKRLIKDLKCIKNDKLEEEHGIYININEQNLYNIQVMIYGPENTPYAYGYYFFDFVFSSTDYPFVPPKVKFCTQNTVQKTRFHPNFYHDGKVCLSILNTWQGPKWSACESFKSILMHLKILFNTKHPLQFEPGYENQSKSEMSILYNKGIEFENLQTAIFDQLAFVPAKFCSFRPLMIELYNKHFEAIMNNVEQIELPPEKIRISLYGFNFVINKNNLESKIKKAYSKCKELKMKKELKPLYYTKSKTIRPSTSAKNYETNYVLYYKHTSSLLIFQFQVNVTKTGRKYWKKTLVS